MTVYHYDRTATPPTRGRSGPSPSYPHAQRKSFAQLFQKQVPPPQAWQLPPWYSCPTQPAPRGKGPARLLTTSNSRIRRYRTQSLEYLANAYSELRHGRWSRSEELLWSSLTLAVKGTALSQGANLQTQEEVEAYAAKLGRDWHDRRIRDAFAQIAKFSDAAQRALGNPGTGLTDSP